VESRRLWVALVPLVTTSRAAASRGESKFAMAGDRGTAALPFELIDNRVFVEVGLNGQGPFHFILDTGAGGFSLADLEAAN
jgi:hypothetical protein